MRGQLATYQGELVGQIQVQARFQEKLLRARREADYRENTDWSGIRLILSQVFAAFSCLDEQLLSSQLRYVYREEH